jgi:hypothetical protein
MRFFLSTFLLLFLLSFGIAQKPAKSNVLPFKRPPEIETLVNEAFFLPDEFGSNLLIKIEQSSLIKDDNWKKEILEKALSLSENAQNPIKKRLAIKGISTENREVFLSIALNQKLDKMSLQLSIVREMLKTDKPRARQIFNQISFDKNLLTSSCADALIPDVSDYYKTLADIANTTFSAKEKKANTHYNFVENQLTTISANIQVSPIAKMISALNFTSQEKENLTIAFLDSLKTISVDNRSFFVMFADDKVIKDFENLNKPVISTQTQTFLSVAFRGLIVKNLQASKCADYTLKSKEVIYFVKYFNANFTSNSPILLDEINQDKIENNLTLNDSTVSQNSTELRDKYGELRFVKIGDSGEDEDDYRETNDAEKNEITWQNKVAEFLIELETWNGNRESSETDFLNKKCEFYRALLDIMPEKGNLKPKITQSYLNFLSKSNTYKTEKICWFYWASDFLQNNNYGSLENSGNETLRVYNKFDLMKASKSPK